MTCTKLCHIHVGNFNCNVWNWMNQNQWIEKIYYDIISHIPVQYANMSFLYAYLLVFACNLGGSTAQRSNLLTMMLFFQFPWKAMPTRTNEIATSSPDFTGENQDMPRLGSKNQRNMEISLHPLQNACWIYAPGSSITLSHQSDLELGIILMRFLGGHRLEIKIKLTA